MAKAPRPGGARGVSDAPEIFVVVDGIKHPFRMQEVTARDAGDLRRATGMSVRAALAAMQADPDIDVIAALVWLSRRQNGEPDLAHKVVADEIGYDTTIDLVGGTDDVEEPDDPQL